MERYIEVVKSSLLTNQFETLFALMEITTYETTKLPVNYKNALSNEKILTEGSE